MEGYEKYMRKNLPYDGRTPTTEEIDLAILQPAEADESLLEHLRLRPEAVEYHRRVRELFGD